MRLRLLASFTDYKFRFTYGGLRFHLLRVTVRNPQKMELLIPNEVEGFEMTARVLAIRVVVAVLLVMTVSALAATFVLINVFRPAVGSVLEGWLIFSFLMTVGSFRGAIDYFLCRCSCFFQLGLG